jgi:hypothetical protein
MKYNMNSDLKKHILSLKKNHLFSDIEKKKCENFIFSEDENNLLSVLDFVLKKDLDFEDLFVLSVEKYPKSSSVLHKYVYYLFNKEMFVDCSSFIADHLKYLIHNPNTQVLGFKSAIFLFNEKDAYLYKKNLDILKYSDPQVEIIYYYLVNKGIQVAHKRLEQDYRKVGYIDKTENTQLHNELTNVVIIDQFGYQKFNSFVDLSKFKTFHYNDLSHYYFAQKALIPALRKDDYCRRKEYLIRLILSNLANHQG